MASTPPRRMSTRPANTSRHPGLVASKPTTCWSSAEVKSTAKVKAAVKIVKKEAQLAGIQRVAEFESNAKHDEDIADATPRPNFAPRGHPASDSEPNSEAVLDGHIPGV